MGQTKKKLLGEILIEDGALTPERLKEALDLQKKEGDELIGQILIRLGYVNEAQVIAAVGKQLKIPYIPLSSYSVSHDSALRLGEDLCRRHLLLPFDQDDKNIFLAMSDPLNDLVLNEIQKKTNLKAQIFISTPSEIMSRLELIFNPGAKKEKKG